MKSDDSVVVLNELLAYESRSLLPRLRESALFVSWAGADEQRIVTRIIDEGLEHQAWLVDAIEDLGGGLLPVTADIRSCNLHFLEFNYLLPNILKDVEARLAAYESASSQLAGNARAAELVSRITERVRDHALRLRKLRQNVQLKPV